MNYPRLTTEHYPLPRKGEGYYNLKVYVNVIHSVFVSVNVNIVRYNGRRIVYTPKGGYTK